MARGKKRKSKAKPERDQNEEEQIVNLDPAFPFIINGNLKVDLGDFGGALEEYDKALNELDQGSTSAPQRKVSVLLAKALCLFLLGQFDKSVENSIRAFNLSKEIDFQDGISDAVTAIASNIIRQEETGDIRGAYLLAVSLKTMDFNTAKTHVTRLRSKLGTKIAYELRDGLMSTGIDLFTNDLFQEAVEYFTEVVRLVCVLYFDREAYFYQAKCFYKLGDYVQARACCTEVLNRSLEDDDEVQKLLESINAAQKTKADKKGTKKKKSQGAANSLVPNEPVPTEKKPSITKNQNDTIEHSKMNKSKEIAGPKSFPSLDVKAAMDATYSRRGSTNKETKVQAAPGARPNQKGLIQKSGPSKDSNSTNKSKGTDLGFSRDARSSRSREPTPPCRSSFVQDVSEKDYLSHFDDSLDSNWDVPITKPETTDELSKQEDGWILVTKNQKPKSVRESISYVNRRTFQSSKDSDQFQQLQNTGNLNRTDFDPFLDRRDSSQRDLNSTDLDRDPLERPSFIPTGLGSSGMPYISSKPHSDTSKAMITECLGNTPKSPWESLEQISRPLKMRQTLGLVKSTQNATLSNKQKPAEQAPNAHASYQMKANSKKDLPEDVFPLCEHFLKKGQPSQFPKPCSRCAENSTLLYGTWSRTTREWQLMRPYPKEVNLHVPFQLCWHFTNGVSCQKRPCTFAHGEKELMLWTMERQSDHDSFRRPVAGPTVSQHEIDDNMPKPQERIRGSLIIHDMRTDKPRPPPAGVYNGNFQLCKWWKSGRRCRFGSNCTFAHGYEELRSWMGYTKEIHEMRIKEESSCQSSETNADISRNKSEIQKLTSKEESSFQKSEPNADVSRNEMVYVLPGVEVSCNKPVSVKIFHRGDERRHTFHWIFTVSFEITDVGKLCQIDLLHRYHECYRFTEVKGFHNDIEIFSSVPTERWSFKLPRRSVMKEAGQMKVAVSVSFETTTFNRTSTQCLKFDFGKKPYLIQGLNVDLADMETLSKISTTRKELELDPSVWTDGSVEIVPSPEKSEMSDRDRLILEEYMLPARIENVVSAQIIDGNMTIDNYKRVMHQLLFTEELFMKKAISSFRLQSVTMYCQQRSGNETTGQAYAENGDLFGFLKFQGNESIQPDDAAGRLLFRYVKSAWIKRAGSTSHKVYEVLIQNVESETVSVTLKLPYQTCLDLQLTNATCSLVDVQFQLNREPLCEWHAAIDRLGPIHLSLLFPTPSVPAVVYQEERQPRNCLPFDPKLNTNQTEVIQRILAPGNYSSPLVVFGPFGTGKTFTLNQAIRHLVTTKHNRILLCTHTNSAADIHVRLLHDYLTNEDGLRATTPLRIYQTNRRLNTDSEIAKKYGLIENNAYVLPTREDVIRHRVVITTLAMSKHLLDLQLNHGFFTHILVDEAAQALEPKALIPLALAGPNTKVVFTGDHMQISPEVYSHYAKDWGLQRSLPERLFDHYYEKQQSDSGCVMYLTENYRCHPDILQFPSDNFYGKELIACSQHASHPRLGSLLFFSVCGVEEARENSYINTAEIEEVVKRVKELADDWPVEWKKRDLSQIGVISAYMPQVRAIRTYLRRESKELKNVTVESIDNVQGKEFRAVFISTVRTSLTCQSFDRRDDQSQSLYWEFLSDPKLLNTAITRAMSLVAVVGDPVALCTAGGCRGNWRDYIRRCHQHGTLHGAPYNEIKKNIDAPLSKINLNPEAAVFVPTPIDVPSEGLECTSQPGDVSGFEENNDFGDDGDDAKSLGSDTDYLMTQSEFTSEGPSEDEEEEQKYPRNEEPKGTTPEVEEADNDAEQNASEGFGELLRESIEDETVFPKFLDKIIKALVEKCKETKEKEAGVRGTSRNEAFPSLHTATASNNKRSKAGKHPDKRASKEKASYNDFSSEDYEICVVNGRQKVRLVNLGFHQTPSSRHQRLTVASRQDEFLDTQLLQRLLFERPDTYLRCTLRLNSEIVHTAFGEIPDIQTPDIKIKGRVRGVFDMDDVVVEKTDFQPPSGDGVPRCQGKIAGVLNHIINPHERQYVCKVDYENPGVLIPINKSVSKIVNLSHEGLKGFPIYNEIRRGDEKPVNVKLMDLREVRSGKFLFLVQYLQWRSDCRSPLGIVIRKLPQGNTLTDSMKILFAEHGVRESFSRESKEEVNTRFPPDWSIPAEEYKVRQRIDGAFTIDPETSKDLDDALTLEQLPGPVNRVGVHIADVSYFVEPGTQLDKEAFFRCTSYYPGHGYRSVPMLPRELSENHCSLLPGKDRLCISVFLDISEEGILIGQPQIERTVLRSACQLTYSEAQKVIDGQENSLQQIPGDVEENIRALSVLAQRRRKLRLRDAGCDHWSNNDNGEDFEAHELVEEMMILANEEIAKFLSAQIPDTPLRTQLPPKEHKRRDWVKQYGQFIKYSKFLRGFYSEEDLKKMTTEVSVTEAAEFKVQETVWIEICHAAESGDQAKLQKLICDESNHPQLAVANSQFRRIQPKSQYVCKQDQPAENVFHFSLGMPCYTHFTSPIRRYIDIQVHRLVLGLTSPGQSSNRTSEDQVAKVCRRSTFSQDNSRKFDRACSKLHLAAKLKENSRETTAVIASIEKEAVTLEVLNQEYNHLSKRQRRIKLSNLNPFAVNVTQEGSEIVLVWKLRLYIAPNQNVVEDVDKEKEREDVLVLLSQGLVGKGEVLNLPAEKWLQIVKALQEGKFKKLEVLIRMTEKIRQMHSRLPESNRPSKPEKGGTNVQHFYEKKLCLRRFEAVQVQMTAHLRNGVLHPEIQLFKINSNVTICVEHRKYPRDCFATTSRYQASRAKYSSVDKYVEAWKPVLAMEAATNAVEESDEFTIHHMNVQWRKEIGENPEGSFNIPKEYCESRQIDFYPGDFVCIRVREDSYRMRATSEASSTQVAASSSGSKLTSRHESGSVSENFWVGHGIIRDVNRNFGRIETLEITMDLHQSASVFPEELLEGEGGHLSTLTVIRRSLPHRRMFGALSTLPSASQLVQSICLGREPSQEFFGSLPSANLSIVREHPMCRLNQLNEYQEEAVKEALRKPLTLVLGPPGTGKTVTGVHIAYWFARRNKQKSRRGETESTPQVIYCGPSNKSVDVVAKYMLRIPGLKIIRVYGDRREEAEFPIPNKPQPLKSSTDEDGHNSDEDAELKAVSLHHIIRSDQCRFSGDLKVYESKFKADREKGLKTSEKEVKAYRKLIGQAEDWALRSSGAQIILCTCAVAGMPRIGKSCEDNIRQCIVDECGMCMEPESLVPITCSGVKQVVLIGDHKQLQPVIQDNLAVTLGLNVSMFERLSERAKMLELQYRMQKDICKFPSDYFYQGRLKTDLSVPARDPSLRSFWPTQTSRSGKNIPLAFCHVEGEEDSSVIKTEKSNEQSKANEREVQKVVHVVKSLVDKNDVDVSKIVILSPYREQRSRISGALKKERWCKDILVTTIAKSQGSEWDYVILSLVRSLSKDELDPEPSLSWLREHLGFLTDEHQMNVGLTRARKGLCIIGNKNLLELHSMWQKLIEFYEENNCLVNESEWPRN